MQGICIQNRKPTKKHASLEKLFHHRCDTIPAHFTSDTADLMYLFVTRLLRGPVYPIHNGLDVSIHVQRDTSIKFDVFATLNRHPSASPSGAAHWCTAACTQSLWTIASVVGVCTRCVFASRKRFRAWPSCFFLIYNAET